MGPALNFIKILSLSLKKARVFFLNKLLQNGLIDLEPTNRAAPLE
jgi:hypothetical protein